ncbi:MAG: ornithine decarboxylase [Acidimicrobiaceae bacterium]|jgi:ornithine decarboxylase
MQTAPEQPADLHPRIAAFIKEETPPTPCMILVLDVVEERYRSLAGALPGATIFYAVKANPEREVVELLAQLGASFDVASPAEIDLCLAAGATPELISYGNTIKKQGDIAYAYEHGVRLFAFDSAAELHKLAVAAPGAQVFCRLLTSGDGADWPLSRKFGCAPDMAIDLLVLADQLGLRPHGVSFHVGSQQRDPAQWEPAIARAASVFAAVGEKGIELELLNLGGGLPAQYIDSIPVLDDYLGAIDASLARHFGGTRPRIIVEPGRYIAGDAGVLHTEVVLVSRKSYADDERWVYIDTGVFGGLAETLGEAIKYRLVTSKDGGPTGPVVIAGPTCDSVDVLYQRYHYQLPLDLDVGDHVTVLSAGAYTKAYCTEEFNGFEPIPAHILR